MIVDPIYKVNGSYYCPQIICNVNKQRGDEGEAFLKVITQEVGLENHIDDRVHRGSWRKSAFIICFAAVPQNVNTHARRILFPQLIL